MYNSVASLLLNGTVILFIVALVNTLIKGENPAMIQWIFFVMIAVALFPMGLWFITVFLLMLMQFFCRYKIELNEQGVLYRRTWLGAGLSRFWAYNEFVDTVMENRTVKWLWLDMLRNPELANAGDGGRTNPYPFAIRFLDGSGNILGLIPDLLEDEAKRLMEQIQHQKRKSTW